MYKKKRSKAKNNDNIIIINMIKHSDINIINYIINTREIWLH